MTLKESNKIIAPFAICYIMFFEHINYLVHAVLRVIGLQVYNVTITLLGVSIALLLYLIFSNFMKAIPILWFPILVSILYVISLYMNNKGENYIQEAISEKLFLYCIPTYIAVRLIGDNEKFYGILEKFCFLILIGETLAIICMTFLPDRFVETDYQGISYALLIPFVLFACKPKYNGKIIIVIIYTALLLLFFGGRGPILCALICLIYKLFLNVNKNKVWIFALIFGGILFVFLYDNVLDLIISISNKYEFAGSIAKYAEMGDIFSDSGRNEIIEIAKQIISERPWGNGLGSTRYWLGVYGFKYKNYPHNIFYEFWCDYGIVAGTALLIALIVSMFKTFKSRSINSTSTALFEICFFSTGFLILIFSSTYIFCPMFFAMIAVMQNIAQEKKMIEMKKIGE